MLEERGNLWDLEADAKCVLTNCDVNGKHRLVMGAGCALEAAQRYPILPDLWGALVESQGCKPQVMVTELVVDEVFLIMFPTKVHWQNDALSGVIWESAVQLMQQIDHYHFERVLLPRPGCGRGGLDWPGVVRPLISQVLDDRVSVVSF